MNHYLLLAIVLFAYMSSWFVVSLMKKRNDVADTAWGLGFVLLAWLSAVLSEHVSVRGILVTTLVSIWGLRLAWHIHGRNKNKTEDYRYRAWRQAWGKWFYARSYVQVYLLQGVLLFMIALPVLVINLKTGSSLNFLDMAGLVVWIIGFLFEVVGDAQLSNFIKNPENKGKLMQRGLWAYSRHPNYFGEVTQWWGVWILALSVPNGWLTILGPLTITTLILKVSGIPMLEKKMKEHQEFAEYQQRVSMFFPLPPRSIRASKKTQTRIL